MRYQVRSDARYVYQTITVDLTGEEGESGKIIFEWRVDRQKVEAALRATPGVEGIFDSIAKAVKSVARSKAFQGALNIAQKALDTPILGDLIPPSVRAGISLARQAARAAGAAQLGNPEARAALGRAIQRAQSNPALDRALSFTSRALGTRLRPLATGDVPPPRPGGDPNSPNCRC